MNEDTGAEYLSPWQLSQCVDGGGVGVIESSCCSAFSQGDVVTSFNWPWQTHAVMKGSALTKVLCIGLPAVSYARGCDVRGRPGQVHRSNLYDVEISYHRISNS